MFFTSVECKRDDDPLSAAAEVLGCPAEKSRIDLDSDGYFSSADAPDPSQESYRAPENAQANDVPLPEVSYVDADVGVNLLPGNYGMWGQLDLHPLQLTDSAKIPALPPRKLRVRVRMLGANPTGLNAGADTLHFAQGCGRSTFIWCRSAATCIPVAWKPHNPVVWAASHFKCPIESVKSETIRPLVSRVSGCSRTARVLCDHPDYCREIPEDADE